MSRFDFEDPIFKSEEPLTNHYSPKTLHNREEELDELARSLSWVVQDEPPKNVFVKGGQGTGKSAAVDQIIEELHTEVERDQNIDLVDIKVQCRDHPTKYQITVEIINKLRSERADVEPMSRTGHSGGAVQEALFEEFKIVGGAILIVLEEIDQVEQEELDGLLYNLSRVGTQGRVSDCKLAFVGITNDSNSGSNLNIETRDSLDARQITFDEYTPPDLQTILNHRAEQAFKSDVVDETTITFAATRAANNSGSARYAIKLLHRSGEIAREKGEETISQEMIDAANDDLRRNHLVEGIKAMSYHAEIVLAAMLKMKNDDEQPASKNEIYSLYVDISGKVGENPRSKRRMKDRVDGLVRRGILESCSGGYIEYKLNVDEDIILECLKDSEMHFLRDLAIEFEN